MATEREMLELAAKAACIKWHCFDNGLWWSPSPSYGRIAYRWNPLTDYGDALRLAVKLRISILFSGSRHHVGPNPFVMDICCDGGINEICWSIVDAAAAIGKAMP